MLNFLQIIITQDEGAGLVAAAMISVVPGNHALLSFNIYKMH